MQNNNNNENLKKKSGKYKSFTCTRSPQVGHRKTESEINNNLKLN